MRTEQGTLLDEARLAEAVAIHEACYRLLQWLASAVDRGFVPFDRAHGAMGESDAAADWIATHFASLPPPCRPAAQRGEPLVRFANYFSSYLKSSFVFDPDDRGVVTRCGCWCASCGYIRAASRLRARNPDSRDKRRAERMKETCVIELGLAGGRPLSDGEVDAILQDKTRSIDVALVAYGVELLRRCDGGGSGAASLALWRQFVWQARRGLGSRSRRTFELTTRLMLEAEGRLLKGMRLAEDGR